MHGFGQGMERTYGAFGIGPIFGGIVGLLIIAAIVWLII